MTINITPGNWGEARVQDIHLLLSDVANQFLQHFSDPPQGAIRVEARPNETNPRAVYRNGPNGEYVVWLTCQNRFWAQYSYQFSHELCHIASNHETLRLVPNQWFHETLCELASLFTLKRMAKVWWSAPPTLKWRLFAAALESYADEFINRPENELPVGISVSDWFKSHEHVLRSDSCQRQLNLIIAVKLLPFLQKRPEQWQSVRHIPNTEAPFLEFLALWREACPDGCKAFATHVIELFN